MINCINSINKFQPPNYKVLIGLENLDRKLYLRFKLKFILAFGESNKSGGNWWHSTNYMDKTPKELRPKSKEPYSKQETSTIRIMTEDIMQAVWNI